MGLAFISSVLIVLALPPFDLWPLCWVGLVPLLLALPGTSPREAAMLGAFSGTVTNYLAFHWILELMETFSKLGPFAYLAMLAMAVQQSVPWALWCYFLRVDAPARPGKLRAAGGLLLSAASFVAMEFFYPIIFPWYLANTQHQRPELTSVVSLGGVSLLSLAIVVFNLCLARWLVRELPASERATLWPAPLPGRRRHGLLVVAAAMPLLLLGFHFAERGSVQAALDSAPKLAVGLVQPNEWIGEGPAIEGLHDYQVMTEALARECREKGLSLDLVLWPESAVRTPTTTLARQASVDGDRELEPLSEADRRRHYPLDVTQIFPSVAPPAPSLAVEVGATPGELFAIQRGHDVPVLFGTTMEDVAPGAVGPIAGRPPLYNCAVMVDGAGKVLGAVKKVKLLMFGETIPGSGVFPQVYQLLPSASCLLSGTEAQVITMGQARLGIMICYEDLLPWFHYELAQQKPQILLNLTNDAWFGKTAEPYSHLALSTLRAVEGRCYLIRSTPTGISVVVDPYGRQIASIPSDQAGTLREEVALLDITTGFERWGDTVAWFSMLYFIGFGGAWWAAGRRSRKA